MDLMELFRQGNWPCLFHLMTGWYCPGCGGTRALAELLKLHIVKSFLYNPMVLYFAVCAALLAAGRLLPRMTGGRVRNRSWH